MLFGIGYSLCVLQVGMLKVLLRLYFVVRGDEVEDTGLLLLGHSWPEQQTVQEGFRTRAMNNPGIEELQSGISSYFLLIQEKRA